MKVLVFGSLNIDKVYTLQKLPEKGETLTCERYELHVGGKGLNQAVSLSRSGADVTMAGFVGADGGELVRFLDSAGVNTDKIKVTNGFTGHAVIEVDQDGQNQMILYRGANGEITEEYCDEVLNGFSAGDLMLTQYETSQVGYMINKAYEKGMRIAFNPSPYSEKIKDLPINKISFLILNEYEGQCLSGETETDAVIEGLKKMLPNGSVILTLGADGSVFADSQKTVTVPAFKVDAVDTTGAGDTFTGYFLSAVLGGTDEKQALVTASAASAVVVTRSGAAETIPSPDAVNDFLSKNSNQQ